MLLALLPLHEWQGHHTSSSAQLYSRQLCHDGVRLAGMGCVFGLHCAVLCKPPVPLG